MLKAVDTCVLTSPSGLKIEVPIEVFRAFEKFERGETGRVEIDFRRGGIAGVRVQKVLK